MIRFRIVHHALASNSAGLSINTCTSTTVSNKHIYELPKVMKKVAAYDANIVLSIEYGMENENSWI